jgi:hypothetical protein
MRNDQLDARDEQSHKRNERHPMRHANQHGVPWRSCFWKQGSGGHVGSVAQKKQHLAELSSRQFPASRSKVNQFPHPRIRTRLRKWNGHWIQSDLDRRTRGWEPNFAPPPRNAGRDANGAFGALNEESVSGFIQQKTNEGDHGERTKETP